MRTPQAVEFVGIPGSGKSTIAAELYGMLSRGHSVRFPAREQYRRRRDGIFTLARQELTYTPRFFRFRLQRVRYEAASRGWGVWPVQKGWRRSRYPCLLLDYIRSNPADLYILDEWLVHRAIWESVKWYHDPGFVARFAINPVSSLASFYVLVDVDVERAAERVMRHKSPYREFLFGKDEQGIRNLLSEWHEGVAWVEKEIRRRGFPVLRMDGGTTPAQSAKILAAWLGEQGCLHGPLP